MTDRQAAALVVIDAQVGLIDAPAHRRDEVLAAIASLLARARAVGAPVLFVQDDDVGGPGSPEWQVHPAIAPIAGEPAIRKTACDAFFETRLEEELRARGVGRLVIVGCKTEYCIDTSCRRATSLGYHVTLVGDAHSTTDSPALPAERIVAHHNHVLNGFGTLRGEITVRPAAEVSFEG